MFKVILSAIAALGLSSFAFAQEPPASGGAPAAEQTAPAKPEGKKMDSKKMSKKHKKAEKKTE